jgi:hypothetical protein
MRFDLEHEEVYEDEYLSDLNLNFSIFLDFEVNNLKINFESDLYNVTSLKIEKFKKRFNTFKNKQITLEILSSKRNSVSIQYDPQTKKLSLNTYNDGYEFCDIECNSNSVNIELVLNKEEHSNFDNILERLIRLKNGIPDYYSSEGELTDGESSEGELTDVELTEGELTDVELTDEESPEENLNDSDTVL